MDTFALILIGVLVFSGFIFAVIVDSVNETQETQETKSHDTKPKTILWEKLRDNFGFSYSVVLDSTQSEFEEDFCELCRRKNVVFSNFEERDKEYEKYRWSRIEGDKAARINEWKKILPYFNKLHDREVTPFDFDKSFISLLKSPIFLANGTNLLDTFLETAYLRANWTFPENKFV